MSKYYGSGGNEANPFFPDETSWEGPQKTIYSPYGSAFEHDIARGNTFEDRLSDSGQIVGRSTKAETGSRSMGQKKTGGRK